METSVIGKIAKVDLFAKDAGTGQYKSGEFVGRPFHLDYDKAYLLVADAWKNKVRGVPQGSFLLAYYENEEDIREGLLLRVLQPVELPTDGDVISSMVEYYKDNLRTSGSKTQLDTFTQYEFSFSGLECRILGTFYKDDSGETRFGADVENFYSAHHYTVVKPNESALEYIVNFREGAIVGRPTDIQIGKVRYSSAIRFQGSEKTVPVYVSPQDFLGKRTALFGMTRTGKSNTVKKIVEATVEMSQKAKGNLTKTKPGAADENLEPFTETGIPKFPVGQIIFDINGEYANANLQDQGTAVFELYPKDVTRYSVLEKPGFKVLKVNFYNDVSSGFDLVRSHLSLEAADYVGSFSSVDLMEPEDKKNFSAMTRYERKRAAYLCCLYRAGFKPPEGFKVKFEGNADLNKMVKADGSIDPDKGITLEEAKDWFLAIWDNYEDQFFDAYKKKHGHEWADEDLKAILVFLSRKSKPGGATSVSGYLKLRDLAGLHTEIIAKSFEEEIVDELRDGRIVIIDLSQGDPTIQNLYSERICKRIFADSMDRFIKNRPNNFVQFYFEEAHNLFPKREDRDLSQIYNRLAKEGAKLYIGLIYATQEVSSISANILKNTQNWFIAHLNNEEETKEIKKYYDFGDFADSLMRFSASTDKGFVRMKTYSNPFVVPVQVDRFLAEKKGE
jgi:DNA helicase HerA-like ATPase